MQRRDLEASFALFAHGWRQAAASRATTFGRVALLVLILLIFWAMWSATPLGELGAGGPTAAQVLWYLAATETIAMSVGYPYRLVEAEIRSGEITTHFLRPLHYVGATFATWFGETTHRFLPIAGAAAVTGVVVTRTLPFDATTGVAIVVGLWIACAMLLLSQLCIGLVATWVSSAAPAFWVWQKLLFVLGGLMIPLTIYPEWLASLAFATPFPAMMFLPASLVFDGSWSQVATVFASQACWIVLLVVVVTLLYRRMDVHVSVNGA